MSKHEGNLYEISRRHFLFSHAFDTLPELSNLIWYSVLNSRKTWESSWNMNGRGKMETFET